MVKRKLHYASNRWYGPQASQVLNFIGHTYRFYYTIFFDSTPRALQAVWFLAQYIGKGRQVQGHTCCSSHLFADGCGCKCNTHGVYAVKKSSFFLAASLGLYLPPVRLRRSVEFCSSSNIFNLFIVRIVVDRNTIFLHWNMIKAV